MSSFNYAQSFPAIVVGEAFNNAIDHAANNGQIAHCLQTAALQCGIVIAAKPIKFITDLNNNYLQSGTKSPDAKSVKIVQALYALATALHESGKVKALPEVNQLPAWACPVAIEQAKQARKVKADAKKAAAAETETETAAAAAAAALLMKAPVPTVDFEDIIIAIRNGDFTASELGQLENALDFAKSKAQAPAIA